MPHPCRRAAAALATVFLLSAPASPAEPTADQVNPAPSAEKPVVTPVEPPDLPEPPPASRREELLNLHESAPSAASPVPAAREGVPGYLQRENSAAQDAKREQKTVEDLFGGRPVQHLHLREAIELALHNNLDARYERAGVDIQRAQTKLAASAFDPVFETSAVYQSVKRPQDLNNPSTTSQILQQQGLQTQLNQAALQLNAAQVQAFENQIALQQEQSNVNQQLILQGQTPTTTANNVSANQVLAIQPITNPILNDIVVLEQEGATFTTSLSGKTALGTRYAFAATQDEQRNTFTGDLTPVRALYDDQFQLQVQQPLLKGFGSDVNLAEIRVSRLSTRVQTFQWKNNIQNSIQGVMAAYYDMTASLDAMRVLEDAIGADDRLVELYRRRVDLGFGSPFDIQQAAVQVSTDRESLLIAKNNFLERQFALKRLVLSQFEASDPRLFFPETTADLAPPPLDRAEFMRTAFEHRYDYRGTLLNAEAQNIRLHFAKNQLLPELDLVATYGLNGLGSTIGHGLSDTFSADHPQWSAGLQFQYPFGNRQAKAQYQAAVATKEQSILRLKQVELAVGVDVDTAISRIETNRQRLEAARKTRELGDEAVRIALRRLEEGQISAYDITEQQRKLYDARVRELSARAELNKAVTILWLATGTILPRQGITFTDSDDTATMSAAPSPRSAHTEPGLLGSSGNTGKAGAPGRAPTAARTAVTMAATPAPVATPAPTAVRAPAPLRRTLAFHASVPARSADDEADGDSDAPPEPPSAPPASAGPSLVAGPTVISSPPAPSAPPAVATVPAPLPPAIATKAAAPFGAPARRP